jgi:formylglycine-generating enzyme
MRTVTFGTLTFGTLTFGTLITLAACGQYRTSLTPDDAGGSDVVTIDDASPTVDARMTSGDAGTDSATGPCPSDMVFIEAAAGKYCIDAHEVSRRSYLAFVTAKAGNQSGQKARCAWNTSYLPRAQLAGGDTMPVVGVDFCDAEAYCTWSGKHVCGRIGGGEITSAQSAIATEREWDVACSRDATYVYPYGQTYQEDRCAVVYDAGPNHSATVPNACEGGYPGLYDMVGNVWEWVDITGALGVEGPQADAVAFVGGSFAYEAVTTCTSGSGLRRDSTGSDIGIRCCK